MLEAGVVPDTEVCNIVAETFLSQNQPANTHELMNSFMPTNNIPLDSISYLLLIQAHDALGLFDYVRRDFELLKADPSLLKPSIINAVLSSSLKHRAYGLAREVLELAEKTNLKDDTTHVLEQTLAEREQKVAELMSSTNTTTTTTTTSSTTSS